MKIAGKIIKFVAFLRVSGRGHHDGVLGTPGARRGAAAFLSAAGLALACALPALSSCKTQPPPDSGLEVLRPIELSEAARTPELDPAFVDLEVGPDTLVITYNGEPDSPIEAGHVVAGIRGGGYLRRVVSAQRDGNRAALVTAPAELVDFIADGAFRASTLPEGPSLQGQSVAEARSALTSFISLFDGTVGCDAALTITPTVAYGGSFEPVEVDIHNSQLHKAHIVFAGQVKVGMKVQVEKPFDCEIDLVEAFAKNGVIVPKVEVPIVVRKSPPIVITAALEPVAALKVGFTGDGAQVAFVAEQVIDARFGLDFADGAWTPISEMRSPGELLTVDGSPTGALSADIGFELGLQATVKLYDTIGLAAKYAPGPRIEGRVEPSLCTWSMSGEYSNGLELLGVLDIPFFDRTLLEVPLVEPEPTALFKPTQGVIPGCECPAGTEMAKCLSRSQCAPLGWSCCGEWPITGQETCCAEDQIWNGGVQRSGVYCGVDYPTCVKPANFGVVCAPNTGACCNPGEKESTWCCSAP